MKLKLVLFILITLSNPFRIGLVAIHIEFKCFVKKNCVANETFAKCSILFKIKEGANFDRRNI